MRIELDDADRGLIAALITDGRASYAKLAPLVGLSQATVRTRVQRLIDERIITITGRADPTAFGLGVFAFAFLEVSGELDKTAARIGEITEAVFVVLGAGRFDLMVELRCRDADHLLEALDRLRVVDTVRRLQSATVIHYEKQDWSGVGNRDAAPTPQLTESVGRTLDRIDRQLVRELMADGRASYATLAQAVGLSQAAVRDRVLDLLADVVTIQVHPDAEAMGIGGFAALGVKASGPVQPIVDALREMAETTLVARTLGRFDLTAEIWFDGPDHLADTLDSIAAHPAIATIETLPYLRVAKEDFEWGGRR